MAVVGRGRERHEQQGLRGTRYVIATAGSLNWTGTQNMDEFRSLDRYNEDTTNEVVVWMRE